MKSTEMQTKKMPYGTGYVAEILDVATKEVLIVGFGIEEEEARRDARKNWKETVERLSR